MEAVYVIWLRDLTRFYRDKPQFWSTAFRSVLWLFFLGYGLQGAFRSVEGLPYTQFMLPGIAAMSVLFTSIQSTITIVWDREFGFMKEMLAAPVTRASIVLGKAAGGTTIAVLEACLVLAFSPIIGLSFPWVNIFPALTVLILLGVGFCSVGIYIASRMKTFEGFGAIINFLVLPVFFLSGALYPIDNLSGFIGVLVRFNPMSYGVDALRHFLLGLGHFPLIMSFAVLSVFTAAAFLCAVYSFYSVE